MQLLVARLAAAAQSQRGQTLAEYSLILALIAVGVVLPTVLIFRGALSASFDAVTACLVEGCGG
jgi:Flp pilus assembly pilin Flp